MAPSTDFFDRQDHARRLTRRLLWLFALSVTVIIVTIYLAIAFGLNVGNSGAYRGMRHEVGLWDPQLFLVVAGGTLIVILLGSLYKSAELASGGESIALIVGGRRINPQTTDLAERRLLNVVEEMALASGVPVPPVYVMALEPGINAFAAGHQPGDAVVTVSAGCLHYLSRDELQGVIGHEFSHILNGDMRLNLRLIGIVYGILVLSIIGYYIMRSAPYVSSGSRSSRDSDNGGGNAGLVLLLLGLVLLIFGYLGVFFGNIIKAAINRQREFLADASSVQFTRNPGGITGALKKIGGLEEGSRIVHAHAAEVSHMFFGDAMEGSFFHLFSTHPPLVRRIQAFEPDFNGAFPAVTEDTALLSATEELSRPPAPRPVPTSRVADQMLPGMSRVPGLAPAIAMTAAGMVGRVGAPQPKHLDHAAQTIEALPQPLLDAARQPFTAQAVIFALLLARGDDATRGKQMQLLQAQVAPPLLKELSQLTPAVDALSANARLPLIDLAVPALKQCSPQQYTPFRQMVDALVNADGKVDLFEYCLRTMLFGYLDVYFGLQPPRAVRYMSIQSLENPLILVLSTLAYSGGTDPQTIQQGFAAGVAQLFDSATIAPRENCTLKAFDGALAELAQSSPGVKRRIIAAVTACIAAEGEATIEESELLRAVAATLGCPTPPVTGTPA